MINLNTLAKSVLLGLLGVRMTSAQAVALADVCAGTVAEAPEICVGAIVACIAAWGLEAIITDTPYDQRAQWIEGFITNAAKNSPGLNTMVIATYHNVPFNNSGVIQVTGDCGHTHQEFPVTGDWATTQGVEIYAVGPNSNCCVEKWGDGGWANWGWYGTWSTTKTSSGSLMVCIKAAPPPPPPPPSPTPPPPPIGTQKYTLYVDIVTVNGIMGQVLPEGTPLYSYHSVNYLKEWVHGNSGSYYQAIMQTDGNFVVYYFDANGKRTPVFWTNTGGKVNDPNWQLMPQHDGNLVLYRSTTGGVRSQVMWASQTDNINIGNGWVGLSMMQNGNLTLYAFYTDGSCDPIWTSGGRAPNGLRLWPH